MAIEADNELGKERTADRATAVGVALTSETPSEPSSYRGDARVLPNRSMTRTLHLVDYDPAWPARFAAEAARISSALGGFALAIEHVGSTAVAGLAGKSVLDIAVAVASVDAADACVTPLEALGYEHRGPHGDDLRRRGTRLPASLRRALRTAPIHSVCIESWSVRSRAPGCGSGPSRPSTELRS